MAVVTNPIVTQLRDDELITINTVNRAADMIEHYEEILRNIEQFGHSHGHGRGYTCATWAKEALDKFK